MMPRIKKHFKQELNQLYAQMDDKSGSCVSGCADCCVDILVNYVEFAHLVSQFSAGELGEIFSKPARSTIINEPVTSGRIIRTGNKTIMFINPDPGPHVTDYCPLLLKGKCAAYDNRPWICRDYHRDPLAGQCYWTERSPNMTMNLFNETRISRLNYELAPDGFQKTSLKISQWYNMFRSGTGSKIMPPSPGAS